MADLSINKKLKLANTKKRFKELQELKKKRNESQNQRDSSNIEPTNVYSTESSSRNTPVESQELSHNINTENTDVSSLLNANLVSNVSQPNSSSPYQQNQESVMANYFESKSYETSATFFDNFSHDSVSKDLQDNNPSLLTYFSPPSKNSNQNNADNIGNPKYFDNSNITSVVWERSDKPEEDYALFPESESTSFQNTFHHINKDSEDVLSQDDPEIRQNEISDYIRKSAENLAVGPEEDVECLEENLEHIFSSNGPSTTDNKTCIRDINQEIDSSSDLAKKEVQHSNVESLRQLSDQLAHMIEPNYSYSSVDSITDLEKRNIELAASLEKEKVRSQQLQAELQDLSDVECKLNVQKSQEVIDLRSELQGHLQTIGLLVAEKTELSSNLRQYESSFKQKNVECEELQARLKASRSRVADLEKELNNLRTEKSKTETTEEQYHAVLETLKQEFKELKNEKDELFQDLLEVREKLRNTLDENLELQEKNKELVGRISLADVKIEQLSSVGSLSVDNEVQQLTSEKFSLESQISHLNQTLKLVTKERDELSTQYQLYAQQLNGQITTFSSKLEQLQQEKENLLAQEQSRIKHIQELERQLQDLQNEQVSYATRSSNSSEIKLELERAREMCIQLQVEKATAEENFTKVSNERKLLLKELEAKTDSISQLENMVEQLRGNQPDSVKLLAAMESDKVAASRAIQQNKELKQQLESIQEVLMKMNNDKVELTENVKVQKQTNKELIEKLQKTELSLHSLADAIEIKDKELRHLQEVSEEMNRQSLHHEQLEDRLRHYEAYDNSAHILQNEIQKVKQTIGENKEKIVKSEVIKSETDEQQETGKDKEGTQEKLKNLQAEAELTENQKMLNKENIMKHLEEKVKKTMQEIADMTDEKQRLEHIVLQLQTETETIGEYVALYQHQRQVLKQKALEKDHQLKQLADDREQIKTKLDKLNQLIKKLVNQKGALPAELTQHQESINDVGDPLKVNKGGDQMTSQQSNIIEPENAEVNATDKTAEEIISLLSEIKCSNLVQPDDSIHHCPWCSGQLITV